MPQRETTGLLGEEIKQLLLLLVFLTERRHKVDLLNFLKAFFELWLLEVLVEHRIADLWDVLVRPVGHILLRRDHL